jgi:hypothetical protein
LVSGLLSQTTPTLRQEKIKLVHYRQNFLLKQNKKPGLWSLIIPPHDLARRADKKVIIITTI